MRQLPFLECMSIHSRFLAVIAKMGVAFGKNCLWVNIITIPVFLCSSLDKCPLSLT